MEQNKTNCTGMESQLADLLLDPERAPASVLTHLAACQGCRKELEELKATMALLDEWKAPEPNPYFSTRLQVRMREEREAAPKSWLGGRLARLRTGFAYGPGQHVRPLAAMALTIALLVGGGAYLEITSGNPAPKAAGQAVVHDLQTLDNNAALLDQMEALSSSAN